MRRTLSCIAAGVGLTMALTACGGGDEPATPPASSGAPAGSSGAAPGGSAATWMDGFCGSLIELGELSKIQQPKVAKGDVAGGQQAIAGILGKAESAIGSAVDGFGKLPAAPVPAGDQAKKTLLDVFTPVLTKLKDAKAKLEAAPSGDQQSILDANKALKVIGTEAGKIDDPLAGVKASPELEAARKTAPNCQKLPA